MKQEPNPMKHENECLLKEVDAKFANSIIDTELYDVHLLPDGSETYQFKNFRIYKRKIGDKTIYFQHFVPKGPGNNLPIDPT